MWDLDRNINLLDFPEVEVLIKLNWCPLEI
jgi:hypothetical protein